MNWIIKNGYQKLTNLQLYSVSFYYTVTTITTVGYGDISGTNTLERFIAVINMILGVVIFSSVSGAITGIIGNLDIIDAYEEESTSILIKANSLYNFSNELYLELFKNIKSKQKNDAVEL